jgi:hypothetical protein
MTMVKRYEPHLKEVRGEDPTATMLEWVNGDWIEYGDYDALAAELAQVKADLAFQKDLLSKYHAQNCQSETKAEPISDVLCANCGRYYEQHMMPDARCYGSIECYEPKTKGEQA